MNRAILLHPIKWTAALAIMLPVAAYSANEVKLLHIKALESTHRLFTQWRELEVTIANHAFQKRVVLHIRQADGSWKDFDFSYDRPAASGREVWALRSSSTNNANELTNAEELEFAIRYDVGGKVYWDNNQGRNYRFARSFGNYLTEGNVYNSGYQPQQNVDAGDNSIDGYVTLRNLAYGKQVRILYSTDNWQTTRSAYASYNADFYALPFYQNLPNPNHYGFEDWAFKLDVGPTATEVVYAIEYKVAGQTFWDNNFGQNYRTRLIR